MLKQFASSWAKGVALLPIFALAFGAPQFAHANTGVRAASGSGQYADRIYWMDWTGYSIPSTGGTQHFSFNLADGSQLSLDLARSGPSTAGVAATTVPTFGGAAMGNAGYTGLNTSNVALYSTAAISSSITFTLSNIVLLNPMLATVPNFEVVMADAESMDTGDGASANITFTTTGGNWQEIERVPASGRTAITLTGVGTQTVVQPAGASPVPAWILATANSGAGFSTAATLNSTQKQGIMLGIRVASVSLDKNIVGRNDPSDQFVYRIINSANASIGGGPCTLAQPNEIGDCTTTGATTGLQGAIGAAVSNGNVVTLQEDMAAGSASTLASYVKTIQCTNTNAGSPTVLPGGGAVIPYDPANPPTIDVQTQKDQISCVITNDVSADMAVTINLPTTAPAGSTVTGNVTCTNNGPSSASSATCDITGLPPTAIVTCTPSVPTAAPLPNGSSIICDISYTAPASGTVSGTATTGTSTTDSNAANNTASYSTAISPVADMAATSNTLPTTVTAGQTVTGQITCTNNGPSVAVNATCTMPGLPAGATIACAPSSPDPSLASGAALTCSVTYTAPATGTVSATVTAASDTADSNPANNTLPYSANVTPSADMVATVNLPATATAGSTVTGSFSCTNNGPSAATAATCSITGLPPSATITCTPSVPTAAALPAGSAVVCNVSYTAPTTGNVSGVATAGSSTSDPNPANNTAPYTTAITASADMAATTNFPSTATAGSTVTGTFTCTNNGPSDATAATCSITGLPPSATITCTPSVPTAAALPAGSAVVCNASYTAPATGNVSGVATAGSSTSDPNPANNTAPYTTAITASADMAATTNFPSTATAGSTVTGTFTCTNQGPSAATAATCDIQGLPADATITCTPTVPTSVPLASNSSIVCNASYTAPATGTVSGVATAGSSTADPNPANNTSPYSTEISPSADMAAVINLPTSILAGSTVNGNFTCTNHGPSPAPAATCSIAGLPSGATVTCTPTVPTAAALANGDSIVCSVTYTAPTSGSVTATATAGSSASDPNESNNIAQYTATVTPAADMVATANFPTSGVAGSTGTGSFTCLNNGPSPATAATCAVTGLPPGAAVVCTPSVPTTSPLAAGSAIVCNVTFTIPAQGTVGGAVVAGSDTTDPNPANNNASFGTNSFVGPVAAPVNAGWALALLALLMVAAVVPRHVRGAQR